VMSRAGGARTFRTIRDVGQVISVERQPRLHGDA